MKPKKKKDLRAEADKIGLRYEDGKNLTAQGGILCATAKEEAIKLTEEDGQLDKLVAKVKGYKFEVGYFTRSASKHFDETLFRDLYPKFHAKCMVARPVFDEEMLQRLVKEKKIPLAAFKAAIVRGKGSKVVDIKRLAQ